MKKYSNLNIIITDGGARRAAWDQAAAEAGVSRMQWALALLDAALPADVRENLPPLKPVGRPAKESHHP